MHVPQLLYPLLRRPNIEIVEARLPERSPRFLPEQLALARITTPSLRQQCPRRPLFQHLHHRRRIPHLRFGQQQMHMFGHHDIADHDKPVTLARLLQDRKESIPRLPRTEEREPPIAGASDKVQVMGAVTAMQSCRHDQAHTTGSIVPALAKNARAGHPQFRNGK